MSRPLVFTVDVEYRDIPDPYAGSVGRQVAVLYCNSQVIAYGDQWCDCLDDAEEYAIEQLRLLIELTPGRSSLR